MKPEGFEEFQDNRHILVLVLTIKRGFLEKHEIHNTEVYQDPPEQKEH